jgi:hypothetical protein
VYVEGRASLSHLTSLLVESAPTWAAAFAAPLHFNFLITCCMSVFSYKDVCVYQCADALFNAGGEHFSALCMWQSNTGQVKVTLQ